MCWPVAACTTAKLDAFNRAAVGDAQSGPFVTAVNEAFVQFGVIHGIVLTPSVMSTAMGMPDNAATARFYAC